MAHCQPLLNSTAQQIQAVWKHYGRGLENLAEQTTTELASQALGRLSETEGEAIYPGAMMPLSLSIYICIMTASYSHIVYRGVQRAVGADAG